jgi:hypothetical protein
MKAAIGAAAALLLLVPASVSAHATGEVHILSPNASFTTKTKLGNDEPLTITISGTFTSVTKGAAPGTPPCRLDAFYVWGCFSKPLHPGTVFVGFEADNYSPQQLERAYDPQFSKPPAYRADHKYTFKLECNGNSSGCGRLRFYGGFDKSGDKTYSGAMNVEIGGDDTPASVRVDFSVIVTGKPNIAIKNADANLVGSRLVGSGHVTFTKQQGGLLVGSESKGSIVHEDVLRGGKRIRLELGVITGRRGKALGTTYSPATGRLGLLLKVKAANDPACPESGLLTPTLVGLTLVPGAGAVDQAVLVGFPATTVTEACKGHSHAWKNGSGGVTVRVRATLH